MNEAHEAKSVGGEVRTYTVTEESLCYASAGLALQARLESLKAQRNLIDSLIHGVKALIAIENGPEMGAVLGAEICPLKAGPAEAVPNAAGAAAGAHSDLPQEKQ